MSLQQSVVTLQTPLYGTQVGGGGGGGGGGGSGSRMTSLWQVPLVQTPKQHWSVVAHGSPSSLQQRPFLLLKRTNRPLQQNVQPAFADGEPFFGLRRHTVPGRRHRHLAFDLAWATE